MKKTRRLIFAMAFALFCILLSCHSRALGQGVNRLLAVGCDKFVTMPSTAPCSANNVILITEALSGGSMNLENLSSKVNNIYSREMLEDAVFDTFGSAEGDDISYLYISTHGIWHQGMPPWEMSLLFSNGRKECRVSALELKEMLDQVPGQIVLMVDACHSGAMIGKGMHPPFSNIFAGTKYKVIASGGGEEDSWFWNNSSNRDNLLGAGFFSGALSRGISSAGGYGADENKNGTITLSEVKRYLLANHGASTIVCYPEEDDFPLLTYDARVFSASSIREAVGNVEYSCDYVTKDENVVDFSFTVLDPVEIIYQLVYHRNNRWQFETCTTLYDSDMGISEDKSGELLSPGRKERSLEVTSFDSRDDSDYVMLQIICRDGSSQYLVSSHVFGMLVSDESPILEVVVQPEFAPTFGEEENIVIHHLYPGEMTITVENETEETVAYICRNKVSRPQELRPWGTSWSWNGKTKDGSDAPLGAYTIRVKSTIGDLQYEEASKPFLLTDNPSPPQSLESYDASWKYFSKFQ